MQEKKEGEGEEEERDYEGEKGEEEEEEEEEFEFEFEFNAHIAVTRVYKYVWGNRYSQGFSYHYARGDNNSLYIWLRINSSLNNSQAGRYQSFVFLPSKAP